MAPISASVCTRRKQSISIYCCECGCYNSYKNTAGKLPKVLFYHFPWKSYEADRRQRWIAAVRRTSPNGDLWQPVQRKTVICSAHFVGNKSSTIAPAIPPMCQLCFRRVTEVMRYYRHESSTDIRWFSGVARASSTDILERDHGVCGFL